VTVILCYRLFLLQQALYFILLLGAQLKTTGLHTRQCISWKWTFITHFSKRTLLHWVPFAYPGSLKRDPALVFIFHCHLPTRVILKLSSKEQKFIWSNHTI